MLLKFQGNGAMLKTPFEIELPDLTIITGANGSGKSQLLSTVEMEGNFIQDGKTLNAHYIPNQRFNPTNGGQQSVQQDYSNLKKLLIVCQTLSVASQINPTLDFKNYHIINETLRNSFLRPDKAYYNDAVIEVDSSEAHLLNSVAENSKKRLQDLKFYDFTIYQPIVGYDIFEANLSQIFKQYIYRLRFETEKPIDIEAPWIFLNKILKKANSAYQVKTPDITSDVFDVVLLNKSEEEIRFEFLSSGEKVIMSLIFALYNSSAGLIESLPKVIMLDEPDASLHPTMCKDFFEVVNNVFIVENKIKVIITTHSPTTVALAPNDDCIFEMRNRKLQKSNKATAIKSLTVGLKNLSIYYTHKKQIFVEAAIDAKFLESVYEKIQLEPDISLNFISTASNKDNSGGGYSKVRQIVKDLYDSGNKSIAGVIDYDLNNEENERVIVIGQKERRNLDSYIFDPLFFALFLLKENHPNHNEKFGIDKTMDFLKYQDLSELQLQNLSNIVLDNLSQNADKGDIKDNVLVQIPLYNKKVILIPKWYLNAKKEVIVALYKATYPTYFSRYKNENSLKNELIKNYLSVYVGLLPSSLIITFERLQDLSFN
ncbi:AAA family ATPase [Mucilaginibacter defluvii]|uniref:Endonuclease GajA/Old nuclease/RecF-like AAA domain-containing protein n=1 Tax=Mucilaginibacter defluvii TaxID=1196019 RepID=A0ABP9FVA1_9SPHI